MEEKKFNYSIIIPHKNIPKLLQRCLDSIPQRDDLEIIVVDDKSNPDIVDFNNFPGFNRKDTTIVFDKSGKGAGRARNIGLQKAKGKWLLFADADDYFNYCINNILDEYVNKEEDVIYFDSSSQDCDLYTNSNRSTYTHQMIQLYHKDSKQGEFQLRYYMGMPVCKLTKHSLINKYNIHFDETPINNDTTFSYTIGLFAKSIAVDERAIYCITVRKNSISYILSDEKVLASIEVFARKRRTLLEHGIDIFEGFIPLHMNNALANNRKDIYDKGLTILKKYGFDESLLNKEWWQPPFLDEELNTNSFFLSSAFGREIIETYRVKGVKYRLISLLLQIANTVKSHVKYIF